MNYCQNYIINRLLYLEKKKKQYLYISSTTLPLHVYISIRIYRKTIIVEFNTSLESFDAPPR